jgi:hypothetical protein
MSTVEPSCIQQFRKICYKVTPTIVKSDEPLFQLLMSAATERNSRMRVVAKPHHIYFYDTIFTPAEIYFPPSEEAYKHFLPVAQNHNSLSYVKNGDRLICKYSGQQNSPNINLSVSIFFTCASIQELEKKEVASVSLKPKKKKVRAIDRAL